MGNANFIRLVASVTLVSFILVNCGPKNGRTPIRNRVGGKAGINAKTAGTNTNVMKDDKTTKADVASLKEFEGLVNQAEQGQLVNVSSLEKGNYELVAVAAHYKYMEGNQDIRSFIGFELDEKSVRTEQVDKNFGGILANKTDVISAIGIVGSFSVPEMKMGNTLTLKSQLINNTGKMDVKIDASALAADSVSVADILSQTGKAQNKSVVSRLVKTQEGDVKVIVLITESESPLVVKGFILTYALLSEANKQMTEAAPAMDQGAQVDQTENI